MGYLSLFVSAFLAATLLPFSSEILLATYVLSGEYNLMWLWIWATLGNVTGSVVNWALGRYFIQLVARSRFLFSQSEIDKAQDLFLKYGVWTLLLAWLPVVGDPLTFIAGVFRVPILLFTVLVFLGKGSRYFVVIYLVI
jgi:membrane protein YqaA with SNARE-associated domain